jgi:prepilin-type N-terminal cleavage/methylation domain-containing protein
MKQTKNIRKAGFTLVEIMIVVAIIGLLAAIAIPNFVKARQTAQTNACVNNLRIIDAAKQQWALEKGATSEPVSSDIVPYLGRSGTVMPTCPLGGSYTINALTAVPVCPNVGVAGHTNAVLAQ